VVTGRPPWSSGVWTGVVVQCYVHPTLPARYSVVLDAPAENGAAMVDVYGSQLLVIPRTGSARG
jgi:hypothetical protein